MDIQGESGFLNKTTKLENGFHYNRKTLHISVQMPIQLQLLSTNGY